MQGGNPWAGREVGLSEWGSGPALEGLLRRLDLASLPCRESNIPSEGATIKLVLPSTAA